MATVTTPRRFTWAEVCSRRMARQGLSAPLLGADPAQATAAMCGAHAQVLSAAELSIGLRLPSATRTTVQKALWSDRTLIKAFGPRGTVHLLPTEDLGLWTGALSALPSTRNALQAEAQLTDDQTEAVVAAIDVSLEGAELTVDELSEAVIAEAGPWAGDLVMPAFQGMWPRWRQALALAGHRGVICFGPNRGRKVTYTSPRRWQPDFAPMDGAAASTALLHRYLHSYGPATPAHFARWLSTSVTASRELFASAASTLERVEVEGEEAWVVAGDTAAPAEGATGVRLLPYFDAYAVGSFPRELLFPGKAWDRALARGQAGNFPVLLVDGIVGGVWHQRRKGRRIEVAVELLGRLTAAQRRELEAQVARLGEVLEGEAQLAIGPVTAGPHA